MTDIIEPQDDLYLQQLHLEIEMRDEGIRRYRAAVLKAQEKGREDSTAYGNKLMDSMVGPLADAIRAFIAERESGKPGRRAVAYDYFKKVDDPDLLAFLTVRGVLQSISRPQMMQTVATHIGTTIQDEVTFRHVREEDRKLYQRISLITDKRVSYRAKREAANFALRREEYDPEAWPAKDRALLGQTLIEMLIASTGIVEKRTVYRRANDFYTQLVPSASTLDFISRRNEAIEMLSPVYYPMICPPRDWTTPFDGAYLSRSVRPVRLIKSSRRSYLQDLASIDMPEVYEAINVAQRTAWKINPFILSVLEVLWDRDFPIGGIPPKYELPIPPKPHDIDDNEEARVEWRRAAHAVHRENMELTSKRTAFATAMTVAVKFSKFSELYFPYQFDFRGRLYAVPMLNPQGPDYAKALLHFAEGKPIDEEGAMYLAIHLANQGDFKTPDGKLSKLSLEERVQWVYENEEAIVACANDPFGYQWWTEADKPFQFLAACVEWAGWLKHGEGFVSHIPVALDGSCSGTQHFSMAFADEVGGQAVNLVPSERPQDIYSLVMARSLDKLREIAAQPGHDDFEFARQWLASGLADLRSTYKRPTMTFSYGSKASGFASQLRSDTLRPAYKEHLKALRDGKPTSWPFEGSGYDAATMLAKVIYEAVSEVVRKSAEAMGWLAKMAGIVAKQETPVLWVTPDGFPVVQAYPKLEGHVIDTMIFGTRIRMTVQVELPEIDRRKQSSAMPPNWVHSLDATHLRMVVRLAAAEGMTSFALVHDSFGVHAADTARFFVLLREAMVGMYEGRDVPGDLFRQLTSALPPAVVAKTPLPPERGELDLQAVLDCDFAFA